MPDLLIAAFLVAHGAVHLLYLAPQPPAEASGPEWPFVLDYSPVLTRIGVSSAALRLVGKVLIAVCFLAFAVAGLALVGIAPRALLAPFVLIGAAASMTVLGLFFRPWLVIGLAIDAVLMWAVLFAG